MLINNLVSLKNKKLLLNKRELQEKQRSRVSFIKFSLESTIFIAKKTSRILSATYIPFPFLIFFDGQREDAFEKQQKNRRAEIPVERISFENRNLPDGNETVRGEH